MKLVKLNKKHDEGIVFTCTVFNEPRWENFELKKEPFDFVFIYIPVD